MSTFTDRAAVDAPLTPTQHAEAVRAGFHRGVTRPIEWRRAQLQALDRLLAENVAEIEEAIASDLGKPALEAYITEIGGVRGDITHTLKKLKTWTSPRKVRLPMTVRPARGKVVREPLGTVLIISPWNYPVHLLFMPLVAALAAGNAVIMKPSEVAPATSAVVARLVPRYLDQRTVRVVEGAVEETTELLRFPWDHIFYTGNGAVGRVVMAAAAQNLTPVTLELGGKSPVFVDESANLDSVAQWLAWGKFLNAGQTCIAPDYVMTTPEITPRLLAGIQREITRMFGTDPRQSPDFGRVVNGRHLERLTALLEGATVAIGGVTDPSDRYLAPTVLTGVKTSDPVMAAEIFGPILPILEVGGRDEAIRIVNDRDKPLALYVFTRTAATEDAFLQRTSSGSLVVNTVIMQLSAPELPFGGVGASGMGAYHGEQGVRTFSHERSYLRKAGSAGKLLALGQPPYTPAKSRLIRGRKAEAARTANA